MPPSYSPLGFGAFVEERQRVLLARRGGAPRSKWTSDLVLAAAKFCNIDRRDDAVTQELLAELTARPSWELEHGAALSLALRFTSSRRGAAQHLAALIDVDMLHIRRRGDRGLVALRRALEEGEIACGVGTYQMSLNRGQVASLVQSASVAIAARVASEGIFPNVLEAANFVAETMDAGVGRKPRFAAAEVAKDLAYMGALAPNSGEVCYLGPGARKGLRLVRCGGGIESAALEGLPQESAVEVLADGLRGRAGGRLLAWVQTIDVEQALCEYAKYVAYVTKGISKKKLFAPWEQQHPVISSPTPAQSKHWRCREHQLQERLAPSPSPPPPKRWRHREYQ